MRAQDQSVNIEGFSDEVKVSKVNDKTRHKLKSSVKVTVTGECNVVMRNTVENITDAGNMVNAVKAVTRIEIPVVNNSTDNRNSVNNVNKIENRESNVDVDAGKNAGKNRGKNTCTVSVKNNVRGKAVPTAARAAGGLAALVSVAQGVENSEKENVGRKVSAPMPVTAQTPVLGRDDGGGGGAAAGGEESLPRPPLRSLSPSQNSQKRSDMYKYGEELIVNSFNVNGWTQEKLVVNTQISTYGGADLVGLVETHLWRNDQINVEGYKWYGHNRKFQRHNAVRASGGVGFLVKDGVFEEYEIMICSQDTEGLLALKCVHKATGYISVIACTYLPPENSPYGNRPEEFFNKMLLLVYENNEADNILFVGDLNARIGNKKDVCKDHIRDRVTVDPVVNGHGKAFLEFLNDACLCVLNGRFGDTGFTGVSHRGRSVVDYAIVPYDVLANVKDFKIYTHNEIAASLNIVKNLPRANVSDHCVLQVKIQSSGLCVEQHVRGLGAQRAEQAKIKKRTEAKIYRKYRSGYMNNQMIEQALLECIGKIEQQDKYQDQVDRVYGEFCQIMNKEMAKFKKGGKRSCTPNKKYWNEELSELWHEFHTQAQIYHKHMGQLSINRKKQHKKQIDTQVYAKYNEAMNKFDRALRKEKRKYHRGLILSIENVSTTNPNKFWEKINALGPRRKKDFVCEALDEHGNVTRDQKKVYDHWYGAYRDLYTKSNSDNFNENFYEQIKAQVVNRDEIEDDENQKKRFNKKIGKSEVRTAIYAAKNKKAVGVDLLPYECFKNELCIDILTRLFNICFDTGIVPTEWTKAIIVTIPKGNSSISTQPLSYRGLSLQSCAYKLYSAVLNTRMCVHLEHNNVLSNAQNGFRKHRSCVDHVYTMCDLIKSKINDKKKIYACYIDFSKAFDYVNRPMAMYRLQEYGVTGRLYNAYKAIYDSALCALKINGNLTEYITTVMGTKQGDNSSPTIFGIFINELLQKLEESGLGVKLGEDDTISVLAYADDIVLLAENEENLQKMVSMLYEWCNKWRMKVNCEKTKVMVFRQNRHVRVKIPNIKYGLETIEVVKSYKYLGVILDDVLDFKECIEVLASRAGRALGQIIDKSKEIKDLGFESFEKLYQSCVCPILDYGSEVWGLKDSKIIDDVQNRAIRYYLGVGKSTPLAGLMGETGWLASKSRRIICMIRYFNRILKMPDNRLPKRVFQHCRYRDETWVEELHSEMSNMGMGSYWRTMTPVDINEVKRKLHNITQTAWRLELHNKPKLRTYVQIKERLEVSTHVTCYINKSARSLITQLRVGVLPLQLEVGRYYQIPVNGRICEACNMNEVEDEEHFLFRCPLYNIEREEIVNEVGITEMNMCDIFKHPYNLAKFIQKIWVKRKNKLFMCGDVVYE